MSGQLLAFYSFQTISLITDFAIVWIYFYPLKKCLSLENPELHSSYTVYNLSLLQVKCDQYWPTRGTETYGLIQVTLLDTVELATYCVRTFSLFKVRSIWISHRSHFDLTVMLVSCRRLTFPRSPSSERLQREEGGEAVPVHGLARPRGARAPHSVPGLPQTGEIMQSSRCRAHGGTLQVRNKMVSWKHPQAWNWFCSLHLL